MPFIEPVSDENARPTWRRLFGAERERLGYVPTYCACSPIIRRPSRPGSS